MEHAMYHVAQYLEPRVDYTKKFNFAPNVCRPWREDLRNVYTIASLARACKKWNKTVTPVLYRSLILCQPSRDRHSLVKRNAKLLRTLAACPHLSQEVLRIRTEFASDTPNPPQKEELELPFGSACITGLPFSSHVIRCLVDADTYRSLDRQLALLLLLCPNVVYLYADAVHGADSLSMKVMTGFPGYPAATYSDERATLRPLAAVEVFDVRFQQAFRMPSMAEGLCLLQLPKLETFYVMGLIWMDGTSADDRLLFHSNCKKLRLSHTYINAPGFSTLLDFCPLLELCPSLESLFLDWSSVRSRTVVMDWTQFGSSQRQHGRKLKNLLLRPSSYYTDEGSIGDLTTLSLLSHLEIPFRAMRPDHKPLPHDQSSQFSRKRGWLDTVLPTSLEELYLMAAEGVDAGFSDWHIQALILDATFSKLRKIVIRNSWSRQGYSQDLCQSGWGVSYTSRWMTLQRGYPMESQVECFPRVDLPSHRPIQENDPTFPSSFSPASSEDSHSRRGCVGAPYPAYLNLLSEPQPCSLNHVISGHASASRKVAENVVTIRSRT